MHIYRVKLYISSLVISIYKIHAVPVKLNFSSKKSIPKDFTCFSSDSIEIEGDLNGFKLSLSVQNIENGLDLIKITLKSDSGANPPHFSLKGKLLTVDVHKYWNPKYNVDRINYYCYIVTSNSSRLASVLCLLDMNDVYYYSIVLGDALNKDELYSELIEEVDNSHRTVSFFEESHPAISCYETELWTDRSCLVLDLCYMDAREYLISTYANAQREWNPDGFKLDFIGFFCPIDSTELTIGNGHDYASVNHLLLNTDRQDKNKYTDL